MKTGEISWWMPATYWSGVLNGICCKSIQIVVECATAVGQRPEECTVRSSQNQQMHFDNVLRSETCAEEKKKTFIRPLVQRGDEEMHSLTRSVLIGGPWHTSLLWDTYTQDPITCPLDVSRCSSPRLELQH